MERRAVILDLNTGENWLDHLLDNPEEDDLFNDENAMLPLHYNCSERYGSALLGSSSEFSIFRYDRKSPERIVWIKAGDLWRQVADPNSHERRV